jgi:hypothetical protein
VVKAVQDHKIFKLVLHSEALYLAGQEAPFQLLSQSCHPAFDSHFVEDEEQLEFIGIEVDLLGEALLQVISDAAFHFVPLYQPLCCLKF